MLQASDGERAKHALEDNSDIELLISDILMPNLDGRELVKWLRARPVGGALPVLMISAGVSLRELARLLEVPHTRFCKKPIVKDLLLREVESLLKEGRLSRLPTYSSIAPNRPPRPAAPA